MFDQQVTVYPRKVDMLHGKQKTTYFQKLKSTFQKSVNSTRRLQYLFYQYIK